MSKVPEVGLSCQKNSTFFGQELHRNSSLPLHSQKVETLRDVRTSLLGLHGIKQYGTRLQGNDSSQLRATTVRHEVTARSRHAHAVEQIES